MRTHDEIKFEALRVLLEKGEMRFSELYDVILKSIAKKDVRINRDSFRVILNRTLDSLIKQEIISKRTIRHKNVRYSIKNEDEARLIVTSSFYWLKDIIIKLLRQNPQNIDVLIFLPGIFPFLFYEHKENEDIASYYDKLTTIISSYGQTLSTILKDPKVRKLINKVEPTIFDGDVIEAFRNISEDADPEVVQYLIDTIRERLRVKQHSGSHV
jgi:DNA-binding HxlR family transcriptional regulator